MYLCSTHCGQIDWFVVCYVAMRTCSTRGQPWTADDCNDTNQPNKTSSSRYKTIEKHTQLFLHLLLLLLHHRLGFILFSSLLFCLLCSRCFSVCFIFFRVFFISPSGLSALCNRLPLHHHHRHEQNDDEDDYYGDDFDCYILPLATSTASSCLLLTLAPRLMTFLPRLYVYRLDVFLGLLFVSSE